MSLLLCDLGRRTLTWVRNIFYHLFNYGQFSSLLEGIFSKTLSLSAGQSLFLSIIWSFRWPWNISLLFSKSHPDSLRIIDHKESVRHESTRRSNDLVSRLNFIKHTILWSFSILSSTYRSDDFFLILSWRRTVAWAFSSFWIKSTSWVLSHSLLAKSALFTSWRLSLPYFIRLIFKASRRVNFVNDYLFESRFWVHSRRSSNFLWASDDAHLSSYGLIGIKAVTYFQTRLTGFHWG